MELDRFWYLPGVELPATQPRLKSIAMKGRRLDLLDACSILLHPEKILAASIAPTGMIDNSEDHHHPSRGILNLAAIVGFVVKPLCLSILPAAG